MNLNVVEEKIDSITNLKQWYYFLNKIYLSPNKYYNLCHNDVINYFSKFGLFVKVTRTALKIIDSINSDFVLGNKKYFEVIEVNNNDVVNFLICKKLNAEFLNLLVTDGNKTIKKTVHMIHGTLHNSNFIRLINEIVYIHCSVFNQEFLEEIKEIKMEKKVIFDVRYNTGGEIKNALDYIKIFVPRGEYNIYLEDFKSEKYVLKYFNNSNYYGTREIVILIGRFTMSSAEIVVSEIKKYANVLTLGETTFGKNIVQKQLKVYNDNFIVVPIYEVKIHGYNNFKGVVPDVSKPSINLRVEKDYNELFERRSCCDLY